MVTPPQPQLCLSSQSVSSFVLSLTSKLCDGARKVWLKHWQGVDVIVCEWEKSLRCKSDTPVPKVPLARLLPLGGGCCFRSSYRLLLLHSTVWWEVSSSLIGSSVTGTCCVAFLTPCCGGCSSQWCRMKGATPSWWGRAGEWLASLRAWTGLIHRTPIGHPERETRWGNKDGT